MARRENYNRKLSRPIVLVDGRTLATLQDAADLLAETLVPVSAQWDALIVLLIEAAEQGGKERIKAATEQLDLVLFARRVL